MNRVSSWDLFDTLVACRHFAPAGEFPNELYPIAENVARVQPNDLIITDYYVNGGAEQIVRQVTGLQNKVIVTEEGKRLGVLWDQLKEQVQKHHGDSPIGDIEQPQRRGIETELIQLSTPTQVESILRAGGMESLALMCREARLRTWHPTQRPLQLLQIEMNFPMLLLAGLRLHEFAEANQVRQLLMCARDCCLWTELQTVIHMRLGGGYRVEYVPSSRKLRVQPTQKYMERINGLLRQKSMFVDVAGTGESLSTLVQKSAAPYTLIFIVAQYDWRYVESIDRRTVVGLAQFYHPKLERVNAARHPEFTDWDTYAEDAFDWNCDRIMTMHQAFRVAQHISAHYQLPKYNAPVFESLLKQMDGLIGPHLDFIPE